MRFASVYQHCPEQLNLIDDLVARQVIKARDLLFLLVELAQHGFDHFPRYRDLAFKRFTGADEAKFIEEQERLWVAIRKIPGFMDLQRSQSVRNVLYSIDRPYYERGQRKPSKLVVLFTTSYNNFQISNIAAVALLRQLGVSFLVLKDSSVFMYMRGIPGLAAGHCVAISKLQEMIAKEGFTTVGISGFSSSGFASLYYAAHLGSARYLGFSVRSDISPGSPLKLGKLFRQDLRHLIPAEIQINLSDLLLRREQPLSARLFHGDSDELDCAHALNLSKIPGVAIQEIPGCAHNTVGRLLSDGSLLEAFAALCA